MPEPTLAHFIRVLDDKEAAHEAAAKACEAGRAKLAALRHQVDQIPLQIAEHQATLQATAELMALQPSSETQAAFANETGALGALQAQEAVIRDQLIPAAEQNQRHLEDAQRVSSDALKFARFQVAVLQKLIPADQAFIEAAAALDRALSAATEARDSIRSNPDFRPFHSPDNGFGGHRNLLSLAELQRALSFDVRVFMARISQLPPTTRHTPVFDVLGAHAERFELGEGAST